MVVTKAAAGEALGRALLCGLKDLCRFHLICRKKAFWMVFGVYGATYGANNLVDVMAERTEMTKSKESASKLLLATGAYTSSSILKDVAFAKMWGAHKDITYEMMLNYKHIVI